MNENGECLVDICAERVFFVASTFCELKSIPMYTNMGAWRRILKRESSKG